MIKISLTLRVDKNSTTRVAWLIYCKGNNISQFRRARTIHLLNIRLAYLCSAFRPSARASKGILCRNYYSYLKSIIPPLQYVSYKSYNLSPLLFNGNLDYEIGHNRMD